MQHVSSVSSYFPAGYLLPFTGPFHLDFSPWRALIGTLSIKFYDRLSVNARRARCLNGDDATTRTVSRRFVHLCIFSCRPTTDVYISRQTSTEHKIKKIKHIDMKAEHRFLVFSFSYGCFTKHGCVCPFKRLQILRVLLKRFKKHKKQIWDGIVCIYPVCIPVWVRNHLAHLCAHTHKPTEEGQKKNQLSFFNYII